MNQISIKKFKNQKIWRIIPSRYPPISLFERVANAEDFDILHELEGKTNDRLRNETGELSLVPKEDRAYGNGAGYVMAAFTHLNPKGSRFSDGTFGIYYAGENIECAIDETKYHREIFYSRTDEPPQDIEMRVLVATLNADLHDITEPEEEYQNIYLPDDYSHSQALGKELRENNSLGIYYNSVRSASNKGAVEDSGFLDLAVGAFPTEPQCTFVHEDSRTKATPRQTKKTNMQQPRKCFAVFKPRLITKCTQERHLLYKWNGKNITDIIKMEIIKNY